MNHRILIPLIAILSPAPLVGGAELPVDFNRDIRPLLAKNCTTCHGGVKQAGGISFIFREDVLGSGESGQPVVVPGDPKASGLIQRIMSSDPDEKMPPPKEHPEGISTEQAALLERWIAEGAVWEEHWAFTPPAAAPLPPVKAAGWPKTDLDHIVLAGMEAEKLAPSPAAAPHEWLRRVSLDLIGLPPTLEDWDAFRDAYAADPEAAMAAAADGLLASPHFGERWAAVWLDFARYSDTFGFEKDPHRDIWPFRDWVIRAFNADMPFDQFTIKQLAGDLLENPEPGDLLATAFHRNTQNNTEGGTDDEEYRMEAVKDRVNTTWTTWQGTTFGCVQCHAHPYDPIPHEDYYQFMAFFNNSEDLDLNSDFPHTKAAATPEEQAELEQLQLGIRALRSDINAGALTVASAIQDWKNFHPGTASASGGDGSLIIHDGGLVTIGGTHPIHSVFTLTGPAASLGVLRLEIFPDQENPNEWAGVGSVVSKLEAEIIAVDGSRRPVAFREVIADFVAGPYDPNDSLQDGAGGFGEFPMTQGPRVGYFVASEPVAAADGEQLELRIHQQASANSDFQACHLRNFRFSSSPDSGLAAFVGNPERQAGWARLQEMRERYEAIPGTRVPVILERHDSARRTTRVFLRGNRLTLDAAVEPGIPILFGGGPDPDGTPDRLDMAKWLVGDRNPLTGRVMANRLWSELFGNGIVETQEDFGSAGLAPTNQPLLDHLALRLKNHHQWRIKPFLREIVLSSTYRQSAANRPEFLARDPKNELFARGPRLRLSAEMVRDQALLVSGLLARKQFGPPVYPPQPEGLWKTVYSGASWNTSEGEDRHRRALYTYRKRTSGYPALLTFDAPTGDICTPRRISTNTPLQALNTLNDTAQIELAQGLAARMAEAAPDAAARLAHGYRLVTLQQPDEETSAILASLLQDAVADYQAGLADPAPFGGDAEMAALVLVANTLLNMDAALNR